MHVCIHVCMNLCIPLDASVALLTSFAVGLSLGFDPISTSVMSVCSKIVRHAIVHGHAMTDIVRAFFSRCTER